MTIRLASLIHDSIVDGPGIRSVVFVQGCPHNCPGCHNPESIPMQGGKLVAIDDVIKDILNRDLKKVTFSGGEPFIHAKELYLIARELKKYNYNLWSYTGYTMNALMRHHDPYIHKFLTQLDVLVDGRFLLQLKSMDTIYRGSSNQRIIDVQKSLQENKVVVCKKYENQEKLTKDHKQEVFI